MSSVDPARPTLSVSDQGECGTYAASDVSEVLLLPTDLISLKEAARLAGEVHPATVRRWIRRGFLKEYRKRPSRALFVSQAEIVSFVQPVASGGAA